MKLEEAAQMEIVDKTRDSEPAVSICCTTFNHEKYIEDALAGFISQKTTFHYEIAIYDDASTDGTSDILRQYQKKYPDHIRLFMAHRNTFWYSNRTQLRSEFWERVLKGTFVAYCEGDDYWIDEQKLQKQYDIMSGNPDISMCLHNAVLYNCKNGKISLCLKELNTGILGPDSFIIKGNIFPTASKMIRRDILMVPIEWVEGYSFGDYQKILYAALKGDIYYSTDVMSVYRSFTDGSWSERIWSDAGGRMTVCVDSIEVLQKYQKYSGYIFDDYIRSRQTEYLWAIVSVIKNDKYSVTEEDSKRTEIINKAKQMARISDDLSGFIRSKQEELAGKENIYIMGAGDFGKRVKKALDENHIKAKGFIVTDLYREYMLDNLKVRKIGDLREQEKRDVFVIVGIKPIDWYAIKKTLEENGIFNYWCPFIY